MLTKGEQKVIREYAAKYDASSVFAFGSTLKGRSFMTFELAVKGVNHEVFFDFYAELLKLFPKPVELMNLDDADEFTRRNIAQEGVLIYSSPNPKPEGERTHRAEITDDIEELFY